MAPQKNKWIKIIGAGIAAAATIYGAIAGDIQLGAPNYPAQQAASTAPVESIENRVHTLELNSAADHELLKQTKENTDYMRDRMDRYLENQRKAN